MDSWQAQKCLKAECVTKKQEIQYATLQKETVGDSDDEVVDFVVSSENKAGGWGFFRAIGIRTEASSDQLPTTLQF